MKDISKKKRSIVTGLIVGILIFLVSFSAFAGDLINSGDEVGLKSGETKNGTTLFSGNNINIDGDINGNTFLAGQNIKVKGNIDGNLFVAGNNVSIEGNVSGTIFLAGNSIIANSKSRDMFVAGNNISIDNKFSVERDIFLGGANVELDGIIGRDARFSFDKADIGDDFKVKGDMTYESKKEIEELKSRVDGELKYNKISTEGKKDTILTVLKSTVFSILGLLLIWVIGIGINRKLWLSNARNMKKKPLASFGIGLATLILIPALIIILFITVIGVSAAIISMLIYGILIYISQIIVAVAIGDAIFKGKELHYGVWGTVLGLIIIKVLTLIPFAGGIISFMIVCLGIGSIVLNLKANHNRNRLKYENSNVIEE